MQTISGRIPATLLRTALAAVVVFALTEIGARIWLTRFAPEKVFDSYASLAQLRERAAATGIGFSMFERHLYIGFVGTPNFERGANRHNSLGFRGAEIPMPKPAGELRVVCVGGSTTYTSRVEDFRKSYPALLEQVLHQRGYRDVRVINAGLPGWTSYETLINFELRLVDLDPDLVIVYHAINDVIMRLVWPPRFYRGDNSGAKVPAPGLDRTPPLLDRSTLLRMLRIRFGFAKSANSIDDTFVRQPPSGYGLAFMQQVVSKRYPAGIFRTTTPAEMLDRNPPSYFRRNLESLVAVARDNGIQPLLLTFAHMRKGREDLAMYRPEFQRGMEEMNAVIRKLGADRGVPVFDFAAAFPQDPALFADAVHVTEAGAQRKAELVADYLVDSGALEALENRP